MFDLPDKPYQFEVIQDHSDYMMAIEKRSIRQKNLSLKEKNYPVVEAWIYVRYPSPYLEVSNQHTGKNELVFSQWYLNYFSCAEKKSAVATMKFYDENQKLINESVFNIQSLDDFKEEGKGTIGELQLNTVCAKCKYNSSNQAPLKSASCPEYKQGLSKLIGSIFRLPKSKK